MNKTTNFQFIKDEKLIYNLLDLEDRAKSNDFKPMPNLIRQVLEYTLEEFSPGNTLWGRIREWKFSKMKPSKQAVKAAEQINTFGNDGSHDNSEIQALTPSSMMNTLWSVLVVVYGYADEKEITPFISYEDTKGIKARGIEVEELGHSLRLENISELLGKPYDQAFFGNVTRDNEMFGEIKKWSISGYDSFKVENKKSEWYRFVTYKGSVATEHAWVKRKSIASRIHDFAFLDSRYEYLLSQPPSGRECIVDNIIGKKFSLDKAIKLYDNLTTKEDSLKDNEILEYWRKIDDEYRVGEYHDTIIPKILTSIYLLHREISGITLSGAEVKVSKTNRINAVEAMVRINSNLFVNWEFHHESLDLDAISNEIKTNTEEILTEKYTIGEIYKSIETGKIKIPVFQRNYVWTNNQIVELINSIKLKYPIGSLLFASTSKTFVSKNIIVDSVSKDSDATNKILLLDGQQRLSSIILILAFTNIRNHMLRKVQGKDEWLTDRLKEIKENIIIDTSRTGKNQKIAFLKNDYIDTLEEEGKEMEEINWEKFQLDKNTQAIFEKIKDYPISTITIDGRDTERLIEVFRRINVGSLKLTHIDLMNAGFNSQDETFNFLEHIQELREGDPYIKKFGYKQEHIVQIWKLLYDYTIESDTFISKNKEMTDLSFDQERAKEWINLTSKMKPLIKDITNYLKSMFGFHNINMVPNDAFVLITAAIKIFKKESNQDEYWDHVIKRTILKHYASGTVTKVTQDINYYFFEQQDIVFDLNTPISWDEQIEFGIKEATYSRKSAPMYKILIGILALQNPVSLLNGEKRVFDNNDLWQDPKKDQHHFLPKKAKGFESIEIKVRDSFANITLIEEVENRKKIGSKSPFTYLMNSVNEEDINAKADMIAKSHLMDKKILLLIFNNNNNSETLIEELFEKRISTIKAKFKSVYKITE